MIIMPNRQTPPSTGNAAAAAADRLAHAANRTDAGAPGDSGAMSTADSGADSRAADQSDTMATGSTSHYRDRPTDDGMKGDGADEPNEGSPRLPKQGPSRRTHSTSTHSTSTGSTSTK